MTSTTRKAQASPGRLTASAADRRWPGPPAAGGGARPGRRRPVPRHRPRARGGRSCLRGARRRSGRPPSAANLPGPVLRSGTRPARHLQPRLQAVDRRHDGYAAPARPRAAGVSSHMPRPDGSGCRRDARGPERRSVGEARSIGSGTVGGRRQSGAVPPRSSPGSLPVTTRTFDGAARAIAHREQADSQRPLGCVGRRGVGPADREAQRDQHAPA